MTLNLLSMMLRIIQHLHSIFSFGYIQNDLNFLKVCRAINNLIKIRKHGIL